MIKKSRIVLNLAPKSSNSSRLFNFASTLHTYNVKELQLKEYGTPETGLELKTYTINESDLNLSNGEIFIKLIAAPINPADINIIQGKYGMLPKSLPSTIGLEGVFEVVKVAERNSNGDLRPGDWVIPVERKWGTWLSHSIAKRNDFFKVKNNLDKHACATLSINPCTAYRMLHDFKDLRPNDTIIQNGANSSVGQVVIQLGKLMNLNVVNIVRKRQNQDELNQYLKSLGAKYIFTDDDLRSSKYLTQDLWKEIPRPRFALNCVGGRATADMVKLLDKDSTFVTYGGMSMQPLTFNTTCFIFKNLKCHGFWLTSWRSKQENKNEFERMIQYLCNLIENDQLKAPKCEEFRLENFQEAFKRARTPYLTSKVLFVD